MNGQCEKFTFEKFFIFVQDIEKDCNMNELRLSKISVYEIAVLIYRAEIAG